MIAYQLVTLPQIAVIGREGLCTAEQNLSQALWQEANTHFAEVAALGMKDRDGSYVGFWGAMSDETMAFQPWTQNYTRGLYLAGIEAYLDTQPPAGWVKWILPARTWLVTEVAPARYSEIFREVLTVTLPENRLTLSGAVCDYTDPKTGKNKLFFPVEKAG